MTALEERQIKGVTAKLIVAVMFGTVSICSTCFYTYYGIKTQIQESLNRNLEQDKLIEVNTQINKQQDVDIATMRGQVGLIDYRVDKLETKKHE